MTRFTVWQRTVHVGVRLVFAFTVFTLSALLFIKLAWEVRERETMGLDTAILTQIHTLSVSWLDTVCKIATQAGAPLVVAGITVAVGVLAWLRRYHGHALLFVSGVGGALLTGYVLKLVFARQRPDLWPSLVTETSFAFPSGHAIASSALAASVVAALWFTRWRIPAMALGVLYVVSIGFTRLYLGVHYPSDVIAGWFVGVGWVAAVSLIFLTSSLSLRHNER